MSTKPKITPSQLRRFVADYHRLMPGWQQIRGGTVARADGPIMQGIGFQYLDAGHYRPMHFIDALVAPQPVGFLHQFLKKWPGELLPRQHDEYHRRLFENMKREFSPPIIEPLDAWTTLDLCEGSAVPRSHEAYALAALNAYFGRDDRARYWCKQHPKLVNAAGQPWEDYEYQRQGFVDSLEGWLSTGEAKFRLQEILKERRKQEGFV